MRTSRDCYRCGNTLRRVQRTFLEKILYSGAYRCQDCDVRIYDPNLLWIDLRKYANCPSCGTAKITLRNSPDPIEKVYKSPYSFVKRILGSRLYRCQYCRLQFRDFRDIRKPSTEPDSEPIHQRG